MMNWIDGEPTSYKAKPPPQKISKFLHFGEPRLSRPAENGLPQNFALQAQSLGDLLQMARLSGLQREVLSLYRQCFREIRNKPAVSFILYSLLPPLALWHCLLALLAIAGAVALTLRIPHINNIHSHYSPRIHAITSNNMHGMSSTKYSWSPSFPWGRGIDHGLSRYIPNAVQCGIPKTSLGE